MRKKRIQLLSAALALLGTPGFSKAGEVFYDFNTQPPDGTFQVFGNANPEWIASGGVNDSGYYKITDSLGSLSGVMVLPDIDAGKVVQAFDFSVDVRIGDGTGNPADGFSINYARAGDPVITTGAGFVSTAAEEGTTTGLGIGFDTYDNGGGDVVGISVRVDGQNVFSKAYPTRNGQIGDLTSLQTGPQGAGDFTSLAWEPFTVKLATDGKLTITYKSDIVVSNLQTTFFPSAGRLIFAARTGGEWEAHHIDNLRLKTTAAVSPTVGVVNGDAARFTLPIDDSGTVSANTNTLQVRLNGTVVTPTVTRTGTQTVIGYTNPGIFFPAGSTQTVSIQFTDSAGVAVTAERPFVVAPYTLFTPAWKTTDFTATSSGFRARVHQIAGTRTPGDGNTIAAAETQLADAMIDPVTGAPYANDVDLTGAVNGYFTLETVNLNQDATDIDAGNPDNFNSFEPAADPRPNVAIPGVIPGDPNNIAAEFLTFLDLKRGSYILGVNSDDGFLATLGHSPLGPVLGSFNAGRGATDSLFRIAVQEDGVYPFRVSWYEGGGGANIEIFSVDTITGVKTLINDPTTTGAINAYATGRTAGFVQSILPAEGAVNVAERPTIKVVLKDDLNAVDDNSIQIYLGSQQLTRTVANNGALTTVSATVANALELRSVQNGSIVYSAGGVTYTNALSFTVEARGFSIEAEDFDYDGGQSIQAASTMPYTTGNLYLDLGAVHDVDYHQPADEQSVDAQAYRIGESPNAPIAADNDAVDRERPGFVIDTGGNYKIGWAGGDWYNYTRTIPQGTYKVIASQSHGDPAGTADRLVSRFGVVTGGKGTPDQQTVTLGSYSAPATGGWGANTITTFQTAGKDMVVRLGGETTLRMWVDSGDYDWFALIPTTERTSLPGMTGFTPLGAERAVTNITVNLSHAFLDTTINTGSIRFRLDGQDVTAQAQVTPNANGAVVSFNPATALSKGQHAFSVVFSNSEGTSLTNSGTVFVIGQENFVIEAEDFNYDSGKTQASASVMPLVSGAYADLAAVHNVDYHTNGEQVESDMYRVGEVPNSPMGNNSDLNRGSFDIESNYRIGWVDGGEWYNYTRTFPQGSYNVYASLGKDAGTMGGRVGLAAGATAQNQTVTELGTFQAPATGAWGIQRLIPMKDQTGNLATIDLGGAQTIRYTADFGNGDIDYLLFVPTTSAPQGPVITVARNGNQLTLTWTGTGTLQASAALGATAQWTDAGTGGTATVTMSDTKRFFRIRQ